MKVTVDHNLCIGDSVCEAICPEVFVVKEDNLAYVLEENPDVSLHDKVREAADACPVTAIIIEED